MWAAYAVDASNQEGNPSPGIFRAFDASNVATELWNSNQNSTRDNSGSWAKWSPPTVANGRVYLGTFDNVLNVYGLLSSASGGSIVGAGNSSPAPVNLTSEGTVDWVHWGDSVLNRKAGVTPQLSGYTGIGGGAVKAYNNDPRAVSWTDGTPTASNPADTYGIYSSNGTGQGFSFTAPADKTSRTVVVHVGGYNSGGTLTAHLSDGSAPDYTDTTTFVNGQYDRNYTLTYQAGLQWQLLTVSWSVSSGNGNVTLEATALQGGGATGTGTIVAIAGTPQSTLVNTAFATPLQATVKDSGSNPVSGATVNFTVPASGASGTFSGTASSVTDVSGVATAPTLTANAQSGSYTVTANAAGTAAPASFSLTNTAPAGSGSLQGSGTSATAAVDLTTEGTTDWVHWGDSVLNRKAGVTPQLSGYAGIGGGSVKAYNNDPRTVSWTDGNPTASSAANRDGLYIAGIGQGFSFTAPADTTSRTLVVHVGGYDGGGMLTAVLSDGSASSFTDTTATVNGQYDRNYTLTYQAGAAGKMLTVTWTMTSGTGNVTLNAAALQ